MFRKCFALLLVCVLSFLPMDVIAQEHDNIEISNEYIRIVVNSSETNTGRFAVGTTGGDPDRDTDRNQHLIYGGSDPWTSYTTVRIGNENWIFGGQTDRRAGINGLYGEMTMAPTIQDDSIVSVSKLGPIEVTQILQFTRSTTTGLLDTARIEYRLHNQDEVAHMVGLRVMLDTMLGANDGAPFRSDEQAITTDTVFYANQMPAFWQAFDSLSDPRVMSQGTLSGPDVSTPDRVYFTNWGSVADDVWNFDFTPGRDFTRKGEFELDSAMAMFWDSVPIAPNETKSYVTNYGLGGVTIAPGDLVLGVTSPAQVTADSDRTETFSVVAYVQNAGTGESRDVVAEIDLPSGLRLVGDSPRRELGNLDVGDTQQTGWQIEATGLTEGELSYSVSVTAINSEPNSVSRNVSIVSPARLVMLLSGPPIIGVTDEKYEPSPFEIEALVRNEGGTTAHNISFNVLHPLGLELARGDQPQKFVSSIEPGQEKLLNWFLRPTGVTGQLPYSVLLDWEGAPGGRNSFIFVPELHPKIWIGEPSAYGQDIVQAGDYFSLSVWATNISDFVAAEFDILYDSNLEIVGKTLDITPGTLFVNEETSPPTMLSWQTPQVDNLQGQLTGIRGERGADNPLAEAFGTLVTIHFKAKEPGEARVAVKNALTVDSNNRSYSFEVEDKLIQIQP